ncbi:DUF6516 family protein [Trinickia sp. Y13]|uniref:toxin-antitoxin system TumE family protein n=1 Tax=Trinickia sp. Y13 TaxID=2917807 RepID=UPI002405EF06|nr:DUF6516 family protein [Trinickia sp. Y13]MDG0027254.1 DUF6516 family protein [Trinickia sp. Y13]
MARPWASERTLTPANHPRKSPPPAWLFYGYVGSRVVGYDNERPKGDHRHVDGVEEPYRFTTPEDLVREFLAEVTRRRAL